MNGARMYGPPAGTACTVEGTGGTPDRYVGYSGVTGGGVEECGAREVLSSAEAGGESETRCGCDRLAEEGRAGISDASELDATGADVAGVG